MRTAAARAAFGTAVAVQLVVLYAPDPGGGGVALPGLDKVVHVAVFAAAAWTGRWAGVPTAPLVVVLAVHAGVSEVVQATVLPGRAGDPLDAVADLVGVALGTVAPPGRSRPRRGRVADRSRGRSRRPPGAP